MTIRCATTADVPRIVEMGATFLRESSYAMFLKNADQLTALAHKLIAGDQSAFLLIEKGDRIVGMLGIVAYDHFVSGDRTAGEVVYWVETAARGCGVRLLRAAEAWARAHGAVLMQMVSPTPRVDQLYARLGYAPIERVFQRAL